MKKKDKSKNKKDKGKGKGKKTKESEPLRLPGELQWSRDELAERLTRPGRATNAIEMSVRVLPHTAQLVGAGWAVRRARDEWPVRLEPATWEHTAHGTEEILVARYGRDGSLLGTRGTGGLRAHIDAPDHRDPLRKRITGGARTPQFDDRMLHVDLSNTAYVAVFRLRVGSDRWVPDVYVLPPHGQAGLQLLKVFGIVDEDGITPPPPVSLPLPIAQPVAEGPPPVDDPRLRRRGEVRGRVRLSASVSVSVNSGQYEGVDDPTWKQACTRGCGWIRSRTTVVQHRPTSQGFNILITGDGFDEFEYTKFDRWACRAVRALKHSKPFQRRLNDGTRPWDLVNVHVVRAISKASGVKGCPCDCGPRCTYYGVEGNWKLPDAPLTYPAFFGIHELGWIYSAAPPFALPSEIDLFVVLVNCSVAGGAAYHDDRIVFVSLGCAEWMTEHEAGAVFDQILVHEAAHVIELLADEYIACDDTPLKTYRNVHYTPTPRQLTRQAVPWTHHVQQNEIKQDGTFVMTHVCGGPSVATGLPGYYAPPNYDEFGDPVLHDASGARLAKHSTQYLEKLDTLGLWWGAQYIEPVQGERLQCGDIYLDPRGRNFYRPMARCMMRQLDQPFCRVCEACLASAILEKAAGALNPPWPP